MTGGATGYTYGITSPITIPDKPCEFRTFIGLRDGGDASDGMTFKVLALDAAGPNDNSTADWASWGEPRVVETKPVMRVDLR